ncbi:MAG: NADH-quinone oxidoreductase subunit NuoG [Bryobacterales bacterium]|nr:NADH-quinone oxidoreductase subunit NuoG [Bryobacterales bacterium]MBV9397955.1 NADH-quinone oxidoreductase subunit NuoG [Bryobacterales bacterium]
MAETVQLTINGREIEAEKGKLLIEVARENGIEIPAFCYYEGLSLQAACRMCLVEVEKTPKLQVGCTLPVAAGMVIHTESPTVQQARKGTLEFLLTNHPLDCPVCDKGGECELQDMVFRYGAGESRFTERKLHVPEKQWSPVVFFDAPRCILCYRCVRVCNEGMGVNALGIAERGVRAEIVPNHHDYLECDECGACIDICPVGALTSGIYRYQTRPWEMNHVGTICTHCADGCRTTLGVRNEKIIRGNNRDRSGINGEFLCVKGRYAFDFVEHPERLQSPMLKTGDGFEPVSWSKALEIIGGRFAEFKKAGANFGVIGSNHTTNEENFFLQKFARQGLGTNNIDHHRTGDLATFFDALSGRTDALATVSDLYTAKAIVIVGSDLSQQHPLLANQIRANVRHHGAHVYTLTPGPVREEKLAVFTVRLPGTKQDLEALREKLKTESDVTMVFGGGASQHGMRGFIGMGDSLGIPVKYICLVDYSNSRGAFDMGVIPRDGGMCLEEMLGSTDLDVLWVVGANPLKNATLASEKAFVVVQDLFMTETAKRADIVLPAASAYEKNGTVTNVCGEIQKLKAAIKVMGTKTDLEIMGLIAKEMGLNLGIWLPDKVLDEIRATVHGYNVPLPVITTGGAAPTLPLNGRVAALPGSIASAGDTLFTSGSLSRYSKILNSIIEAPGELYADRATPRPVLPGEVTPA